MNKQDYTQVLAITCFVMMIIIAFANINQRERIDKLEAQLNISESEDTLHYANGTFKQGNKVGVFNPYNQYGVKSLVIGCYKQQNLTVKIEYPTEIVNMSYEEFCERLKE